jgi:hypothetical protein
MLLEDMKDEPSMVENHSNESLIRLESRVVHLIHCTHILKV